MPSTEETCRPQQKLTFQYRIAGMVSYSTQFHMCEEQQIVGLRTNVSMEPEESEHRQRDTYHGMVEGFPDVGRTSLVPLSLSQYVHHLYTGLRHHYVINGKQDHHKFTELQETLITLLITVVRMSRCIATL